MTRIEAKVQVLRSINVLSDKYLRSLKPFFNDILPIQEYLFNLNLRENVTALGEYCLTRESFRKRNLNVLKFCERFVYTEGFLI